MTLGALNDAEIRALPLDRITDHLESRGWSAVARYGGHGRIYRNVDGSEVVVPGREDTWDYAIVVREVLRALTDVDAEDGKTVDLIKERQWERPSDRSVHGYVLKCQRRENQDVGVVTVQSLMPDIKGVQTIHMSLGREDYSLALRLHDQKLRVDARGELRQTGKATWELEGAEIRESLSEQWDEDQRGAPPPS